MDNTPLLDLTNWVCERRKIKSRIAVGDSKYGTVKNMTGIEQAGIKAYGPIPDLSKRNDFYPTEDFPYDPVNNQYICPQGHPLSLWSRRISEELFVCRSDNKLCNACPVKSECTKSKSSRHSFRSFDQKYVEKGRTYHPTPEYQKAMSKRAFWVEPLFGEAKEFHRLRRFRLRSVLKVNIEGVMIAAAEYLKIAPACFGCFFVLCSINQF